MQSSDSQFRYVLAHWSAFARRALRAFRADQGLLLAGALACYAMLSIVPLLILIALSTRSTPASCREPSGIGWSG